MIAGTPTGSEAGEIPALSRSGDVVASYDGTTSPIAWLSGLTDRPSRQGKARAAGSSAARPRTRAETENHMKTKLFAAAAVTAFLAISCSSAGDSSEDSLQRIVSISPTATEMLFAIGAGDRVVAVDKFSYYPEEAPVTDLDGWNPNIEAIAGYEPDLVVLQASEEVIGSLEALGITVVNQGGPSSFDEVYAQISELGVATGLEAQAAEVVADMEADIAALVDDAPDASGSSYYHELDDTLFSITSDTFIGEVYGLFGLANVADPADADGSAYGYPQLSEEYLLDADPDLIFLADTLCCDQTAQTVSERPGWDQLSAVRDGNVIELNDDIASRWGPRLVDFVAAISQSLQAFDAG